MTNDALPTPEIEYRVEPRDLPLFDQFYEPRVQREVAAKRKSFRRALVYIYGAFEATGDGTFRETGYPTLGIPYAKAMSPSLARLLFQVWCHLPPQGCEPCRRLVLRDGRCTECRVKPRATPHDLAALVCKLEAQNQDLATGDFEFWRVDRLKRADGRKCQSKVLYEDYRGWVRSKLLTRPERRATRNTILSHRKFGEYMRATGYRYVRHGSGIFYVGLALRRPQIRTRDSATELPLIA